MSDSGSDEGIESICELSGVDVRTVRNFLRGNRTRRDEGSRIAQAILDLERSLPIDATGDASWVGIMQRCERIVHDDEEDDRVVCLRDALDG